MSDLANTWQSLLGAIVAASSERPPPIVVSSIAAPASLMREAPPPVSFIEAPAGRNIALATGLRAALPDTPIVLVMNADSITLGTNHLIHAARRNVDMTVLLLRSDLDAAEAPDRTAWGMPPYQRALETMPRPLEWVAALEAAYVGRATLRRPEELDAVLCEAIATRGFAVIGITSASHLPTGVLSRNPWPEHFDTYRLSAARVGAATTGDANHSGHDAASARHDVPRCEVRIAGVGGQGIKLAGTVLAEAAGLHGGLWATERGEYGSATRGGPSMVDVVIGSDPITYPGADHPDVLVLLSQAAADRYAASAKHTAFVFADSTTVKSPPPRAIGLPITDLARQHTGKPIAAGVVSLGCVAAVADAVSLETLNASMSEHIGDGVVAMNVAACAAGYATTRTALKGIVHG